MKYVQPKVFDITKQRPAVLLVGNGLNRCMGDTNTWLNAILRLTKDDGILDSDKDMNYSIRATVTTDENENDRWEKYAALFGKEFKYIDNPLLKNLLQIPFEAILTTNYTYELENALDPNYVPSSDKEKIACTTAADYTPVDKQPDSVRLLNTFNRISNGNRDMDIWHIHGEVREPCSMILTHEEYGRLVYELVANEQDKPKSNIISFESWIDYFIYGDLYVLGQGIDFAEFDLWWLLSRRHREGERAGKAIFYSPQEKGKIFTKIEDALDQIGMKIDHCSQTIPDPKEVTGEEFNDFFRKFYETATFKLRYKIENPIPFENDRLIDYRDKCMVNPTKTNKIRLLYQLSKTEVYLLGANIKSKVRNTVDFYPIKKDPRYDIDHSMFLFSTEDAYPSVILQGQELRKMTGLEALDLAQKDSKIDDIFLDLQSTRKGVWFPMKQAEYMRHTPEELKKYEKAANEKDKTRRKMNARKASEHLHHVGSFISNNSFPDTLEKAWDDIKYEGYFHYETILHEPEVQWTSPQDTKEGDIVFFALTRDAEKTIMKLQEEQKKTKKYPKLAKKLSTALKNHQKYGGKIYAIGQVCELPYKIKPDDPFYVNAENKNWRSEYTTGITNIIELDHPVEYKLKQGSYTIIRGEEFSNIRDLILESNKDMKFPQYFLKSTASDNAPETVDGGPIPTAEEPEKEPAIPEVPVSKPQKPEKSRDEHPKKEQASDKGSISMILQNAGVEIIDKRANGGAMWVIGGNELKPLMDQCKELGVKFIYASGGGKATKNRAAWWTKDPDPSVSGN